MSKYKTLVNILDRLRREAADSKFAAKYLPDDSNIEHVNQARSRAFIHLYLMVSFGILDVSAREHYVTDGANDGGIDGYYIDSETKTIFLIQSKFRTTERNFSTKEIELRELLSMQITRILEGEVADENGASYNGKIQQMTREIRAIDDIARYSYQVVILANLKSITQESLTRLAGGYPVKVLDHEACFQKLVFPVACGTYFNAADLNIYLDLSNKNAGAKISYDVKTQQGECSITVLFVPTLEIARVLSRYKNSILKYNPRSYLELEGNKVNVAIRETIEKRATNEFALFNNGITMISADTRINERIGQKNKAQLALRNPQIINGGQTAFTLSRMLEERSVQEAEQIFADKEVLLKVITLEGEGDDNIRPESLALIEAISTATNQQTTVSGADRYANEVVYLDIQRALFERYGLLFERKRGEFGDGVRRSYVEEDQIIERNLFFRLYLASAGELTQAVQKKLFLRYESPQEILQSEKRLDDFYFTYLAYRQIRKFNRRHVDANSKISFAKAFAMLQLFRPNTLGKFELVAEENVQQLEYQWQDFVGAVERKNPNHLRRFIDRETGESRSTFNTASWLRSRDFEADVRAHFRRDTQ